MADSNKMIGDRIRCLREERELTQAELAKALNVKRETVGYWENGDRDLKTGYTIALANFFGVSCDEILRGIKPENLTISKDLGLSEYAITCLRMANNDFNKNLETMDLFRKHFANINAAFLGNAVSLESVHSIEDLRESPYFEQYTIIRTINSVLEYEYKSDEAMVALSEGIDTDEAEKKYNVKIQILSTIRDILNMKFIKDRQVIIDDSGDMNIISAEEAFYSSHESYSFSAKSIIEARLFEKLKAQIIRLRELDGK